MFARLKSKPAFTFLILIFLPILIFGTVGQACSANRHDQVSTRYLCLNIWVWESGAKLSDLMAVVDYAKKKGFNTISLAIPWGAVEAQPNKFSFEWLDDRVDYIVAQGLNVVLRVTYNLYPHWIGKKYFMKEEK